MSTVRLVVLAIVDAHRGVGLESPVNAGVTETLRGVKGGASQKQVKPLDADALAPVRATAFTPRRSRGGSLESYDTALKRGRLDIALASVLSDAGLRVSEAVQFRLRDILDAENGAGLVYIEGSKTDQAGEGAYQDDTPGAPLQVVQTHGRRKSPSISARNTRGEKALEALEWLV